MDKLQFLVLIFVCDDSDVARNFRQGLRQPVAFLSVHSRLESIEARLNLVDKHIGTSARFYA